MKVDNNATKPTLYPELPTIVCVSSLFATDRILLHSTFIDRLLPFANPLILSEAVNESSFPKDHAHGKYFQSVNLPIGFPGAFTLLRHLENFLWDHKGLSASRESSWRLRKGKESPITERALRSLAIPFSSLGIEAWIEKKLESALIDYASPQATLTWLRQINPAVVIAMYPFLEKQMVTIAAAKQLAIPVVAFITSWDNITTKPRMIYEYDGYLVWSEQMKKELHEFYPQSRGKFIAIVGAPQYDVFFQPNYQLSRSQFLSLYSLDPSKPIVLYSLGSPNMVREDYGAVQFIERAVNHPALSQAQIIIRTHPGHLEKKLTELEKIREAYPQVVVQGSHKYWQQFPIQGKEAVVEWVNTVRHADVVINLASTMTVDAAIFDRPVVNINFDPEPGGSNHQLINEINSSWNHFSPISQSGGIWTVTSIGEMVAAAAAYLKSPELHRRERRWIVERVCGKVDGRAGARMAEAVIQLLNQAGNPRLVTAVRASAVKPRY